MAKNAIDELNFFKIVPPKSSAKVDITNDAARAIIRRHAEHQHAKTKILREARLTFEALQANALPEAGVHSSESGGSALPEALREDQSQEFLTATSETPRKSVDLLLRYW